ncbi:MAG: NAD(P)/FAD-dependent oxidoreductase [Polyangia bacterium]
MKATGVPCAVVIGSGLGSLTAAAYLAKNGFPVTVVEQRRSPGGYAAGFERAGGRFDFDVSLHQTPVHGTSTARILRDLGVWDELELVRLPELCRIVAPGLDVSLPQTDPDGVVGELSRLFPAEKSGIRGFVDEICKVADEINRMPILLGIWQKMIFPFEYPRVWKARNSTAARIVRRHTEDPRLASLLATFWNYCGLPPERLSGFYFSVATGQYVNNGAYCVAPRSRALTDALAGAVEKHGGRILLGKRVELIVVEDAAVAGVELSSGDALPAGAVLSGASGPETFDELLPPGVLPRKYRSRLARCRPSISTFVVWLGLDGDVRDRISTYENFLFSSYDHDETYEAHLNADPHRACLAVTVFDNAFQGYSRPGTSTVGIMFLCGYEPWRRFEDDYFAGRKQAYDSEKARLARILIDRAEQHLIPGLSKMIEVMEVATPLTNRRFTGNAGGAVFGYEQSLQNAFIRRLPNRTPLKGLYLASAWGFPGGGLTGAMGSGLRAFENLRQDFGG